MVKPSSLYSPSPEPSLLQQNPPINSRCVQNMMIGETLNRSNPTVQIPIPHWDPYIDDPPSPILSPYSPSPFLDSLTALHRFLPSNDDEDLDLPVDAFSCDHFRMYEFKVRKCARGRSHDWTECPYAHAGEKARRRDPRKYHYSGTACPDFRKGGCRKGDSCEFAHGVFECWLHPARYRTQPCKDGKACRRRVCFFAHTPEQLRILPQTYPTGNGSGSGEMDFGSPPFSYLAKSGGSFVSSPTSILTSPPVSPPSDSPPMSPSSPQVMSELVASMRLMRMGSASASGSWAMQGGSGSCSNSRKMLPRGSLLRPGFCSMPSTPTRGMTRPRLSQVELLWDNGCEEEPTMERVESGRDLRARLYAKLSKENSLDRAEAGGSGPDVGWISELVK